jgi:hypothetical protein
MFNIFIVGPSQSGKTTIAKQVGNALSMPVISASDWARNTFVPDFSVITAEDKQKFIIAITEYSTNQLRKDPDMCLKYIRQHNPKVETERGYVLEGFRSPRDFLSLFNPATDLVVYLDYYNNPVWGMPFEYDGLKAISYSLVWLVRSRLMTDRQLLSFTMKSLDDVKEIANEITNSAGIWFQECPVV